MFGNTQQINTQNLIEPQDDLNENADNRKKRRREDTSFQCPQCHRVFGRIEHLRRHATSHGEARSFRCLVCGKGFNRLDTLQRHELIHQKDPGVSKLKGARACRECANSKVRCNGTMPCERCTSKNADCVYPSAGSPQTLESPSSAISDVPSTPGTSELLPSVLLEPVEAPRQLGQSLPFVGLVTPSSEQHVLSLPDTWTQHYPELTIPQNPLIPAPLLGYDHGQSPQDSSAQQVAFSPFEGSYAGTDASFEVSYISHVPRDRHASLDQLARRPRLTSNMRSKTAVLGSDGLNILPTLSSHQEEAIYNPSDLHGSFHRTFAPATSYLSRNRRFNFPLSGDVLPAFQGDAYASFDLLSEHTYNLIHRQFMSVCTGLTSILRPYGSSFFPSRKTLNAFVKLYLERFHPIMPILHQPTLNFDRSHWILSLAVVTLGSHVSEFDQSEEYSLCLDEFLRRAMASLDPSETYDRITLCQAKLLGCINQIYSGEESWQESAYSEFCTDLVGFCQLEWKMSETGFTSHAPEGQEALYWSRWVQLESCRRTGYAIWMLDSMWAYQFQVQPKLTLEDGRMPLPCQEVLWEAKTAMQWHHIFQFSASNLTLLSALQSLQNQKGIDNTMGEFSRIILLHGFYHQSWKMDKQTSMYTLWRESICDSLDVLQWSANSVVNAASGMEHATMLHLHLARIVLFAPFQNLCDLAYGMTKEDTNIGNAQMSELRMTIRKWVVEDGCKARLAALHAGALFRHLQNFHTGSFYEPSAVLLATLTLWAYAAFTNTTTSSQGGGSGQRLQRRYSDTQGHALGITLDRPVEADLVRWFVRDGRDMAPTLRGVGSLVGAGGAERVLLEGSKLVSGIGRWGSGRKVMRILNNLSLCRSV